MGRPKTNHTPTRQCRACRRRAAKAELERWVLRGNQLILDVKQREAGRGWYSCRQADCSRKMSLIASQVARSRRYRPTATNH